MKEQQPLTKEQYMNYALKLQTCKKCKAKFICRGDNLTWIPAIGPKFTDNGVMIDQNTTLAQRTCRPHGDSQCINPDKSLEGGLKWDTQIGQENERQ